MKNKVITVTMNPSIDKTVVLDELVPYELNRVKRIQIDAGGKGINVARVVHNFNFDVTATGLIAGKLGSDLLAQMDAWGIPHDFLEVSGETRTNLKILDESVNRITEINEPGFQVAPSYLEAFVKILETLADEADIIAFSGSLPPGVPEDFYAVCIDLVKKKGVKALLDADGAALAKGLAAVPYAVKLNRYELETLLNEKFDSIRNVVEAAKGLVDTGIEIVIVSLGADGMVVADKKEAIRTECWNIPIQGTVGAGDSVLGALACSILNQDSLFETARLATAAGTITASKCGTQLCELEEVLDSKCKVTIKAL